ncbi:MAG: hypothetical protein HYU29_05025 [Chloroflexi bacterium]|nr:hypothetical protein [Chloroflexota bacterium]
MEGRFPLGIRAVLTNCADAAKEREFNQWYTYTHLGDMLASGLVTHAIRYEDASPKPGEPRYLAIYEIERDSLETVPQKLAALVQGWRNQGRIHEALEMVSATMWRSIGPQFKTARTGRARVTGLFLTQTNCADASREQAFNRWYDGTHVPDILATGLYHTAYRFEAVSPQPGQARYLALYETDAEDSLRAAEELLGVHRPRWLAAGRYTDGLQVVSRSVFRTL